MNFYLSYGAGVGSEALRLWLLEQDWPFEAVHVDHGCDWPETYEFLSTVPDITIIKPDVQGHDNLYDYCAKYRMVPSHVNRWCTDKFKIRPLNKYFKRPAIIYIGFSIDESQRIKKIEDRELFYHYPLVAQGMTRQNCIEYIQEKTGNVPTRSGCWFCPFQPSKQWIELKRKHPKLYEKAKILEQKNMEYRKEKFKPELTLSASGKALEEITHEHQRTFNFVKDS